MNKIELAKMIGLITTGYTQQITKHDIENLLEYEWMTISETFSGNIEIEIEQEDLASDCLDIKLVDLERDEDTKVCIQQIEDLPKYLEEGEFETEDKELYDLLYHLDRRFVQLWDKVIYEKDYFNG